MAVKPSTIALISTAVVASFGLGYLIYYDHKRRTDPEYKKQLKRERKKALKTSKQTEEKQLETIETLMQSVLTSVSQETFPETAEAKEAYFTEQVALGEQMLLKARQDDSVVHFYKALKVYPVPLELIMIYQQSLPEQVFRILVNLMALEQQKRTSGFFEYFPPKETHLKLKEVQDDQMFGLIADKGFAEGEIMYTETPLISALYPSLEGTHCNYCMKKLDEKTKIECTNCDQIAFCSKPCESKASEQYHVFMCSNNKLSNEDTKASTFLQSSRESNAVYPQMIAQLLSSMVAEEQEKTRLGKAKAEPYSAWDHIEKFKTKSLQQSETLTNEATKIKDLLETKVPGIGDFLKDEIYLQLKGKLEENAYQVATTEQDIFIEASAEPVRVLKTDNQKALGHAIYKISSFIGKSEALEEPNVFVSFKENSNVLVLTAVKEIKKGEQIKMHYQ